MKTLMLGNKAFARGLYEAGCSFISSYPGTPSTEITEEAAKFSEIYAEWAPNEKVALEAAFGASLGGTRAFCAMKHVGLNVAADPLYTISYTGVAAGLVIGVADDAGMHSSQNEQDSRHHAIASKITMLEPSDSAETLLFVKKAYEISEEFDTPVLVKMCTRVAHSQSIVELGDRIERKNIPYEKNAEKYVMTPAFAKIKHPVVEQRQLNIQKKYTFDTLINKTEYNSEEIGIITDSTSYQYVKEVFGETVSVLKIGMINPMPDELIMQFAQKVKKLYIVEELDPIIEEHVRSLGLIASGKDILPLTDEFSQNIIREKFNIALPEKINFKESIPARPPVMCPGCPHRGLFYALSKNKLTVMGDIGCYALGASAPLSAVDCVVCMGASVSSLHGFIKSDESNSKKTVAVIGDSTFMHSGITGLVNTVYNNSASTVIILDNSITGMTGHQQNPTTGVTLKGDNTCKIDIEALCKSLGIKRVRIVDPYDLDMCDKALKEELTKDEVSVIISRRPCVLLKYVKTKPPVKIDPDKCQGCKSCLKLGCPAVSFSDKKARIDETLCVGCGVCEQLCKFGAFVNGEDK